MIDKLLALIDSYYHLKKNDVGEFETFDLNGMNITVKSYLAAGLGYISCMTGDSSMFKMDTLVINPIYKDIDEFSYDRIIGFDSDNIFLELFDMTIDKSKQSSLIDKLNILLEGYQDIPEQSHKANWYDSILLNTSIDKKGDINLRKRFDDLAYAYLNIYLSNSLETKTPDLAIKQETIKNYCNNLLKHGGPSTDAFMKTKGKDFTEKFYRKVLFRNS